MPSLTTHQHITIADIDVPEKWNIHPFLSPEPPETLKQSILTLGLLHPIIVQKSENNRYHLICGRYRLQTYRSFLRPSPTIPACVLDTHLSLQLILSLILEEQAFSAALSPMELAYFFNNCLLHMSIKDAARLFLPVVHEKPHPHKIKQLLLLLELEPEIQQSVHFGRTGSGIAYELLKLTANDRLALHGMIQEFDLGGGKQKRLLTLTKELAAREEKTITALLGEYEYRSILEHQEMNNPQKLALLLSTLHRNLFPESYNAEKEFQDTVNRMKLPAPCSITHSDAFESDEINLTVRFSNLAEVDRKMPIIKNLVPVMK